MTDTPPSPLPYRSPLAATMGALVNMMWSPSFRAGLIESSGERLGTTEARILWELGYRHTARPTELAEAMEIGLPSITKALAKMRERGLVTQGARSSDGRVRVVELTAAGRDTTQHLYDVGDDLVSRIVADWDPEKVDEFTGFLEQFVSRAETLGRGRTPEDRPTASDQ